MVSIELAYSLIDSFCLRFPYDIQNCTMKFGAWSYTGYYVDLRQLPRGLSHDSSTFAALSLIEEVTIKKDEDGSDIEFIENGMDLSFFYK